ncbi:MAG: rRNA (cytidine-2'-O-)-methyltransferase, partial [Propionivibrio sp.]
KVFETIHSAPLGEALAWLQADGNRQRGEFVLIVSGAPPSDESDDEESTRVLKLLVDEGLPVKQAAQLTHAITGAAKNAMYELALSWKKS